jgi:protease IV
MTEPAPQRPSRFREGMRKLFLPITLPLGFIQNHFKAMLFVLIVFLIFAPSSDQGGLIPNNLQHIALKGAIFDASEVLSEIEAAENNNAVKGVLFEINSPGGAVAPSVEIAYAVQRLAAKKPVVVYASGIFASGGYYAAIYADEIYANPGSIVGSIGVIMQGADFSELMGKIGIKPQIVSAGKYKQVGTSDRPWSDEERKELNKVIQGTYDLFVNDVAQARDLDPERHRGYADAHIFTAAQAKEAGLIDQVGVMYDARQRLVELTGVDAPVWNQEDRFEKFIRKLAAEGSFLLHTYTPALQLR